MLDNNESSGVCQEQSQILIKTEFNSSHQAFMKFQSVKTCQNIHGTDKTTVRHRYMSGIN